ncbi:hypothetical protein [Parendozoicomonas sp. Alg238-R29]|uniref:flagellar basal body rod protein FlgC n=1 Tax=Parendozoicomonas sp. Alg238-R29 TaxID=2993446 RepID=UPI00248DC6CC|nr:hypothetical protein [Parendozoicomonas sp. Alg238-R29]
MSFQALYAISSQSMFTQDVRINLVAGNLANAEVAANSENAVFQSQDVVMTSTRVENSFGVMVSEIVKNNKPANVRYQPDHPLANDEGQVFYPAIDTVEQVAAMMSSARSFETAVSLFSTGRHMQDRVVDLINL